MTRVLATTAVVAMLAAALAGAAAPEGPDKAPASAPRVDLVLCLDTSNSMDGLIDAAKQKLWTIVSDLATAKPQPVLRVGLYQYGNDGLSAKTGHVQQVCPLTRDLDSVYEKLFALKTNGGTELVARVIRAATEELEWNPGSSSLKLLFVAGNEPATQDPQFTLEDVCAAAIAKGILVNTIHCGSEQVGRDTGWADAARWGEGRYAAIDADGGTVTVVTPYDQKIAALGSELNKTYVAYGKEGQEGLARQQAQDANASTLGAPAAAARASGKANALYSNTGWDLVDALNEKKVKLEDLKDEELPKDMQGMDARQRQEHVEKMAAQRAQLQKQIQDLGKQRDEYVRQEIAKKGLNEKSSFDAALRQALHEQAGKKGLRFEEPASAPAP